MFRGWKLCEIGFLCFDTKLHCAQMMAHGKTLQIEFQMENSARLVLPVLIRRRIRAVIERGTNLRKLQQRN